jgi:multisubunit Na+/H+ antiporter MnhG subunit
MYFSLFLTIISFIVHLSTYIGIYLLNDYYTIFSASYIIHILIFIPFGTMIIKTVFNKDKIKKSKNEKISYFENYNPLTLFKKYLPNINPKFGIIIFALFVYVFINFFASVNKMKNGTADILDGKYVLNNHDKVMEIDKKEYVEMKYTQIKTFSGHWIVFSIIPFLYFYNNKKKNKKENGVRPHFA